MEEFEDEKELCTSEKGSLLLQIIKVPLTIVVFKFNCKYDQMPVLRCF